MIKRSLSSFKSLSVSIGCPADYDIEASIEAFERLGFFTSQSRNGLKVSLCNSVVDISVNRDPPPSVIERYLMPSDTNSICKLKRLEWLDASDRANVKSAVTSNSNLNPRLREIVIPCGDIDDGKLIHMRNELIANVNAAAVPRCPDLYTIDYEIRQLQAVTSNEPAHKVFVRILPSDVFCLILRVPEVPLEELLDDLTSNYNFDFEMLGDKAGTDIIDRQIQIISPHLCGIDVRFAARDDRVFSYFNEGPRAVLHGTLPEIQSARVFGGAPDVVETKYGNSGDCWSEMRAVTRRNLSHSIYNSLKSLFRAKL